MALLGQALTTKCPVLLTTAVRFCSHRDIENAVPALSTSGAASIQPMPKAPTIEMSPSPESSTEAVAQSTSQADTSSRAWQQVRRGFPSYSSRTRPPWPQPGKKDNRHL